jgi:hypothetical protein
MTLGTFFTGLIDDVRIYTRVVKPQDILRVSEPKDRQHVKVVGPL